MKVHDRGGGRARGGLGGGGGGDGDDYAAFTLTLDSHDVTKASGKFCAIVLKRVRNRNREQRQANLALNTFVFFTSCKHKCVGDAIF